MHPLRGMLVSALIVYLSKLFLRWKLFEYNSAHRLLTVDDYMDQFSTLNWHDCFLQLFCIGRRIFWNNNKVHKW